MHANSLSRWPGLRSPSAPTGPIDASWCLASHKCPAHAVAHPEFVDATGPPTTLPLTDEEQHGCNPRLWEEFQDVEDSDWGPPFPPRLPPSLFLASLTVLDPTVENVAHAPGE